MLAYKDNRITKVSDFKDVVLREAGAPQYADVVDAGINLLLDTVAALADGKITEWEIVGIFLGNLQLEIEAGKDSKLIGAEIKVVGIPKIVELTARDVVEAVPIPDELPAKVKTALSRTRMALVANLDCFAAWQEAARKD